MPFAPGERRALLAVKGIGPTVLARLEQLGIDSAARLAQADALDILANAARLTGSTCWKNSPQARAAIESAIDAATALGHPVDNGNGRETPPQAAVQPAPPRPLGRRTHARSD